MVSLIDAPKKAHSLPFLQKRFLHGLSPKKVGAQLLCTTKNCSFIVLYLFSIKALHVHLAYI